MASKEKRNGIILRVVAGVAAVSLLAILGLSFRNQSALAQHSSIDGPHGEIVRDLATIKADVDWIRKTLESDTRVP